MDKKADFIPYTKQWIGQEEIDAVVNVLRTDWVTQGPKVDEFEKKVAAYCGAKYGVAVSSGTAALHAACFAAGIKEGDEVITPSLTFLASANCVLYQGAKPVFCDNDPDTYNVTPDKISRLINKKTKAVIPVDFAGHPCEYDELLDLARKHKLLVIEDACHSLGALYKNRKVGSLSDMTVMSFHPAKSITTGEGGMILTDRKLFYDRLRMFRNHGTVREKDRFVAKPDGAWYYEMQELGYNYRLTDIQCAIGIAQMDRLDKFIELRRRIVGQYEAAFKKIDGIKLPAEKEYAKSAWHIYIIRLTDKKLKQERSEIFDNLRKNGIGVNVHYLPVHMHPYYRKQFNYKPGDYPEAEKYYNEAITLPLFPRMTKEETGRVIDVFTEAVNRA